MGILPGVPTAEARAWAAYIRALRAQIAERKREGVLPPDLGAPEPLYRTLREVLAAVDRLPADQPTADLELPADTALRVFVRYASAIHEWADFRVGSGVLDVRRPPAADRFWALMRSAVEHRAVWPDPRP